MDSLRRYIFLLACLVLTLHAQWSLAETLVYLEHSNTLEFDQERLPDAQILRGDVCFRHDDALMYCDSAYFFEKTNSVTAMGNVRFIQGDTLSGTGDILYYDGNRKLARLRSNVVLVHTTTTLSTDSCNYDRKADLAYYFHGGKIVDDLNTLVSDWGQYCPSNSQAVFRTDVLLTNPKFTLATDTLFYNTASHIAKLVCHTEIVYEEETTITSHDGWYNTETEQSTLYQRSLVHHIEGRTLTADTLFYDKKHGYGRLLSHISVVDSTNTSTLTGNFGEVWEIERHGYATDSALLIEWSDSLNYSYMHADTLFTEDLRDSIYDAAVAAGDSILPDSTYHRIRAHHNVRIYRSDMQAVCDSLAYDGRDSVMTLYTEPVCWNEQQQVSADTVHIYLVNEKVDHLVGIGSAIAIQQAKYDPGLFNQMSGKIITAYVIDGEMRRIEVSGNAETVFYPEDNKEYVGLNTTQSPEVTIYLADQTIERVLLTTQPQGMLYPLDQIPPGKEHLTQFFWATQERPMEPDDVFLNPARTIRPRAQAVSATAEETEEDKAAERKREEQLHNNKNRNRKSTLKQ